MKPKSTHKQAATHNRDTKQTVEHKKERPKTQPQDLSRPSKNIPLNFEATGTRGRRLRLAGVSICNRTAAGQPDVESLCPLWAPDKEVCNHLTAKRLIEHEVMKPHQTRR
jgi:hypothetical protein